jgi:hypothetical protein
MTLLVWSNDLSEWQRDALRRIAISDTLSDENRAGIRARLKHAHGIAADGDVTCERLTERDLPASADDGDPTILCGMGPARNVDRLAGDQELRFGIDGITLVYGDNGTGKSGYARIAKKLCLARAVDELQGNVFAEQAPPPAEVRVRYRLPAAPEPQSEDWTDGSPRPVALARMMVLDSASAKVYIDGQNEITYLPREIEIAARLGELCTAFATEVQLESEAIGQPCRGAYGVGYDRASPAGELVSLLVVGTELDDLPDEESLRTGGAWDEAKEEELAQLEAALAQDPAAHAAARRRAVDVLNVLADQLEGCGANVGDAEIALIRATIATAAATARAAALSARDRFANEPIPQTGGGAWERMYGYARQFSAEAGVRAADQSFQAGDPCPVCQNELNNAAAARLRSFDDFVRSAAATEAAAARMALAEVLDRVRNLHIPTVADAERMLAEYRSFGGAEAAIGQGAIEYCAAVEERRAAVLAGADAGELGDLEVLPASAVIGFRAEAARLEAEALTLEAQPADDAGRLARVTALRDAQRLASEIDAVLARRAELELRQRLLNCRAALDTRPISTFASRRRRELVTQQLRDAIVDEIGRLDLGHIPLRFEDTSDHGRNFFDMSLDTRRQAAKARVLSEGEQRALGIACFLAEMKRVPGRHGIIVDDPVSSLDHFRIRKVAERLVEEAAAGRQVIVFTHHLIFYQEILSAAAAQRQQVPVIVNLITKADGQFGVISENDEPWIAKKVVRRIEALRTRFNAIPASMNCEADEFRRIAKDFYTDLRETWERLVEEVLLACVVERFSAGVKTQSLREVLVEDSDYQTIFAAMKRVSEFSGHDMAAGRQLPVPSFDEMRRDLEAIEQYRADVQARKNALRKRRRALEEPPVARVV